ncbi:MAG: tRNA (adenosine(37)-N6)-threonylcarbamoyltransferase complex dimerization subunit type 1 TsaB [Bacillota bacterium]
MLTLAIDTTTAVCSVALARGARLLAEIITNIPRTHSQRLMPLVDMLFQETGLTPADLELLAVTRGPGSFTGLRIGMATVKGLGLALDLPVVGVSSLQVLAHNFGGGGLVCPVLNARREQVYTALFRTGAEPVPQALLPEQAMSIDDLVQSLKGYQESIWFCGDAVDLVLPSAQGVLAQAKGAPLHLAGTRAAALADLARHLPAIPVDQLTPLYLRESQAELQLRRKQGVGHGC